MPSWTKADLQRLDATASGYWLALTSTAMLTGNDAHVARVAARLRELGGLALAPELERLTSEDYLPGRANLPRECRAAARLLARVRAEGLPTDVRLPWAGGLAEVFEPLPAPVAEPPRATVEEICARDAALAPARVESGLARVVTRGETIVRRADGDAFGETTISWESLESVTGWHAWAAPAAAEMGVAGAWAAQAGKTIAEHAAPMLRVWERACETLALPEVLDLRGLPATHGVPGGIWLDPLAVALDRAGRGCVLLVADNSWALERILG